MKKRKIHKWKIETAFLIIGVMAIVVVALVNIVATTISRKYPVTIDLTQNKVFNLDESTINYIQQLEKEVLIQVLAKEETFANNSTYNAQANEIFKQFDKYSNHISVAYVDYLKDPTFATKYPELQMKHGDILVSADERYRLVKTEELFNYTQSASGGLAIASSKVEETISSAILNVTGNEAIGVSVLTGHAEYAMGSFANSLTNNNYELRVQNLVTEVIDNNSQFALLIAPKTDLSDLEIERLDDYLYNEGQYGKTLLYFADASQPELPRLEAFLKEWGIAIGDGAVFETEPARVHNYHPFYPIADYVDDTYSQIIRNKKMPIVLPLSRPLNILFEYRDNYSTKVLLEFGTTSGVRPSDAGEDFVADQAIWRGPIPALVMASNKDSHIIVGSSAGMIDSYVIDNPSFTNSEYILGILNTLSERENALQVKSKAMVGNMLNISKQKVDFLGVMFIIIIPLIILGIGIAEWHSRRHK